MIEGDIKQNIMELANRLRLMQDFNVNIAYFDETGSFKLEAVGQLKFMEIWNDTVEKRLYKLNEENGRAYIKAHQSTIKEFSNIIEKLLLEISKLEILKERKQVSMEQAITKVKKLSEAINKEGKSEEGGEE